MHIDAPADAAHDWEHAMRTAQYERAWRISDDVLRGRDRATRDQAGTPYHLRWVWDGTEVDGRHVLVRCYHGLGDTLQYARFLPALRSRAASVTVEAQPELVPLIAPLAHAVAFDPGHPRPGSECDVEIMELSHALRLGPADVPVPYLPSSVEKFARQRLATPSPLEGEGRGEGCDSVLNMGVSPLTPDLSLKGRGGVALCWLSGGWDPARSIPLDLLRTALPETPLISLQRGPAASEAADGFLNPGDHDTDIGRTAALIAASAIVVTVDSMVAHLAGGLGHPTMVLLKRDADWRWNEGGRAAWYPSARLFRQRQAGDWAAPLAELAAALTPAG